MTISNIPDNICSGRAVIRTDVTAVDAITIKADLQRVLPYHANNRRQIRGLQEYLKGYHPAILAREKTTRTDIDNKVTVNYPWSITRDIVGYFLGKSIQYTNRKGSFRQQMENFTSVLIAENKPLVDYQIANDLSICGVGYRGVFTEPNPLNGTHLKLLRLDPIDTFVVHSTDPIKPPVYAVTSYETEGDLGRITYYKVYTPSSVIVFKDMTLNGQDPVTGGMLELVSDTQANFGGGLPIVEYTNNLWRMGDWEMAIDLFDAIDGATSDGLNDIQQAVNSVLVVMGAEMTEEMFANLSSHGFLNVANVPAGVKPIIEFINQAMSADVGIAMRDYLEATLRVVVGVPDRKTRGGGGGDTGDAVFMRDGWQDIDLVACSKEPYFIEAERQALATMLYALNVHKEVSSIKAVDIDIHFNRNKTANMQSKAQVYQILSGGSALAPVDALDMAGLTNNVNDVIMRADDLNKQKLLDAQKLQVSEETNKSDSDEDDAVPAGAVDKTV